MKFICDHMWHAYTRKSAITRHMCPLRCILKIHSCSDLKVLFTQIILKRMEEEEMKHNKQKNLFTFPSCIIQPCRSLWFRCHRNTPEVNGVALPRWEYLFHEIIRVPALWINQMTSCLSSVENNLNQRCGFKTRLLESLFWWLATWQKTIDLRLDLLWLVTWRPGWFIFIYIFLVWLLVTV